MCVNLLLHVSDPIPVKIYNNLSNNTLLIVRPLCVIDLSIFNVIKYFRQESTEEVDDNLSQALLLNISESIAPEDVASKSFNLALALTADGYEVKF